MKKLLYISGIDWNWIKQRPQIIGEGLSKIYDTYVVYPRSYRRHNLTKEVANIKDTFHIIGRIKVPLSGSYRLFNYLDFLLQQIYTRQLIKSINPDIVYISHPRDYLKLMEKYDGVIVYDYMDNYEQLAGDYATKKIINKYERKVVSRADFIICTSDYLKKQMVTKYPSLTSKIEVIRNGYLGDILDISEKRIANKQYQEIAYVGTVGPWFDFDILLKVVEKRPEVIFHIFGPISNNVMVPDNEHIVFEGVVEHREIYEHIKECDGLIMPFCVNEIVEAVDPVKLYEYINFNKPIISVYYEEINHFKPFVLFYNNLNELIYCLDKVKYSNGSTYSEIDRKAFLLENSWDKRIQKITFNIEKLL